MTVLIGIFTNLFILLTGWSIASTARWRRRWRSGQFFMLTGVAGILMNIAIALQLSMTSAFLLLLFLSFLVTAIIYTVKSYYSDVGF